MRRAPLMAGPPTAGGTTRRAPRRPGSAAAVAFATLAAVLAVPGSASAATVTSVRSFDAGTLSPGQSKSYTWNNANSDIYQVNTGAVPSGDPSDSCATAVTRQWYRWPAGGSRQFLFTIKNVDTVSCDVTVYLAIMGADRSGSTGTLGPGQAKSWSWNNADVDDNVYLTGVTPSEPTSGTCQLEVTWRNRAVPSGEQRYVWTVRNTGSVACGGQWQLGWLPVDDHTYFPGDPPTLPGNGGGLRTPVAGPYRVYVFGLTPVATGDGNCDWGPVSYEMDGDPAGPTNGAADVVFYQNVGSVACVLSGVTQAFIS